GLQKIILFKLDSKLLVIVMSEGQLAPKAFGERRSNPLIMEKKRNPKYHLANNFFPAEPLVELCVISGKALSLR
ncbi:hypothetical protein, partial [Fulvivirga kasyanovii]|uniref:hypothetical protein n=1 Tax=Fulvivirga kasyanovii TaxID=396812 RepID=UPI001C883DA0